MAYCVVMMFEGMIVIVGVFFLIFRKNKLQLTKLLADRIDRLNMCAQRRWRGQREVVSWRWSPIVLIVVHPLNALLPSHTQSRCRAHHVVLSITVRLFVFSVCLCVCTCVVEVS